ncbi:MAG: hypothetical protein ACI376_01005 [Candidatus Bruticola sp.]
MAKKNTFGFIAFTAAASLGLAITAAGCGTHNGSSEPAPLGGNNSVIFNYALMPNLRTAVGSDITKVRYSFIDEQGKIVKTTDAYELKHTSKITERNVAVPNVPSVAYIVSAAYYDDLGSIVAVGLNSINWNYDLVQAEVANPQIAEFEYLNTGLQASSYVIKPEETTSLSLPVMATDGSKNVVNLIAFADVTGLENYTDVLEKSATGHTYTGVSFTGEHEGMVPANTVKAVVPITGGNITAELDNPIYVTSQTITSIKLEPDDIEGKAITVYDAEAEVPYSKILTVKPSIKNADLSQKVATFHPVGSSDDTPENVAIGTQYFKVTAIYSDTPNRGPVPENIDVTQGSVFTLEQESDIASVTKNRVDIAKQELEPLSVTPILVHASFNNDGRLAEPITDKHRLDAYYGESSVGLTYASNYGDTLIASIKAQDIPEESGLLLDMVGTITYVNGDIDAEKYMTTDCFVLPAALISKYPELETYCPSEVDKISMNATVDNQYRLTKNAEYGDITETHVIRLVNESEYKALGLPDFLQTQIEP